MDWDDLRYFLAAQRAGSLGGAARALKVEHTTVSRRIAALEAALPAKLFARTPDGLALTAAGQSLLPLAEAAERAMAAVERHGAGSDERIEGTVRLSTSEAMAGFVVKRLGELRQRHPELLVEVLSTNRQVDLARGEAEIAIRNGPMAPSDLVARKLAVAGWSLFAARSYVAARGRPASAGALAGHDVIDFDDTLARTPGAMWLAKHKAGARVMLRANSLVAAMNASLVGLGIAVLPFVLAASESQLERLSDEVIDTRDIWLVTHPDLAKVARVRAAMDFLVELFERERAMVNGEA